MKSFPQLSAICLALLFFTVTGCEEPDSQPDTAELRAELEQLENQIGRLEFRVFELEQRLGEYASSSAPPDIAEPATASPTDPGRYDLTPVE